MLGSVNRPSDNSGLSGYPRSPPGRCLFGLPGCVLSQRCGGVPAAGGRGRQPAWAADESLLLIVAGRTSGHGHPVRAGHLAGQDRFKAQIGSQPQVMLLHPAFTGSQTPDLLHPAPYLFLFSSSPFFLAPLSPARPHLLLHV